MRPLVCWYAFGLSVFFVSIEVKCSISVFSSKIWLAPFTTPLLISPVLQLVSESVKDFLTLVRLKSTKAIWNEVLANLHSSMARTTYIGRSAYRHIFRVLGITSGRFVSMPRSMPRVLGSLLFRWSSMIRTTRHKMLCSPFSCLSLAEFERVRHSSMAH